MLPHLSDRGGGDLGRRLHHGDELSFPDVPMPPTQSAGGRPRRRRRHGRPRRVPCREKEHVPEPSITVTSLCSPKAEAVGQDTSELGPQSVGFLTSSPETLIFCRKESDWGLRFYIRVDLQGLFHTYPDVGGPFQNLQEADKAIDRYLHDRRDPKMHVEGGKGFSMERMVRNCLYWPDGRIKKGTTSHVVKECRKKTHELVQVLVDKYNDDHKLLGDLAHELKDVVKCQEIVENWRCCIHFNFTTKSKGADDLHTDIKNLFFAEVTFMPSTQRGHEQLLVNCCCMVNPTDNAQDCYGCTNHGNVDMKHPNDSARYSAGHLDVHLPFSVLPGIWSDSEDDDDKYLKAKEAKIRHMYQGLDDPRVIEELFTLPPHVTIVGRDRSAVGPMRPPE